MKEIENNPLFWQKLNTLFLSGNTITTIKKGSLHHKYRKLIYPCDFGYLEVGGELVMEAFFGSGQKEIDAAAVEIDILYKKVKVLAFVGLTEEEEIETLKFLNQSDSLKCLLIRKGDELPDWAKVE